MTRYRNKFYAKENLFLCANCGYCISGNGVIIYPKSANRRAYSICSMKCLAEWANGNYKKQGGRSKSVDDSQEAEVSEEGQDEDVPSA